MSPVIPFVPEDISSCDSARTLVAIMRDGTEALAGYYHRAGRMHRNINPNIFMIVKKDKPDELGLTKGGILLHMDEDPIYPWSKAWTREASEKTTSSNDGETNATQTDSSSSEKTQEDIESLPVD
ncbi:hypothetical protein QCA50_014381 [Cerrena zonata]|uniref:Uncharacterized protein n=1 Tax=Cerrena zonata TaxID=2478898 RepID=A0AAW0FPE5_9APHY